MVKTLSSSVKILAIIYTWEALLCIFLTDYKYVAVLPFYSPLALSIYQLRYKFTKLSYFQLRTEIVVYVSRSIRAYRHIMVTKNIFRYERAQGNNCYYNIPWLTFIYL